MIVNDFLNLLDNFLSVRRDDCFMNNMFAGICIGYDVIKTSISLKYTRDIPLRKQVMWLSQNFHPSLSFHNAYLLKLTFFLVETPYQFCMFGTA